MKKRRMFLFAPLLLLLLIPLLRGPAPVRAAGAVSRILLDGEVLTPRDATGKQVTPFVRDGTTYLPVRAIGQAFGMDIAWDQDSNAAYVGVLTDAGAPQKQIRVYVDGNLLQPKDVNGKSVPPIAMEGTVYLPVRALSQALGCSVEWDQGTRTVRLYSERTYLTEAYRVVFAGDWSTVKNAAALRRQITEEWSSLAKPMARWCSRGTEPHTVTVQLEPNLDFLGTDAIAATSAERATVFCRADWINTHDYDWYFGHEFTHCIQQYSGISSSWWTENLADASRFRYYASPAGKIQYSASDATVRDWGWRPYGHPEWFYAYVDEKYPTRQTEEGIELGLLDRLHYAFLNGEVKSDGGTSHTDPDFNAIVRACTGKANMEELRKQYVRDLDSGAWKFTGYTNMEDSFLTENAHFTAEAVSVEDNLLLGARMLGEKDGFAGACTESKLADGDLYAVWENPDFSSGNHPYAVWDLGKTQPLTGATLMGWSRSASNERFPGGWDLLVSTDGKAWTTAVSCRNITRVNASFSFPQVSARYVMLRLAEPAAAGDGAGIREFMVFGPDTVPADSTPVSSRTVNGVTWTGRFADGTPNGTGRAEGPDGVYIGEFLWGERQGQGILYQKDGSVLEGCWLHGVLYGPGSLTRPDGSRVTGIWENGQLNS